MYRELTDKILSEIRKIKSNLTIAELVMNKLNLNEFQLEEGLTIVWNNLSGITSKILELVHLLEKLDGVNEE